MVAQEDIKHLKHNLVQIHCKDYPPSVQQSEGTCLHLQPQPPGSFPDSSATGVAHGHNNALPVELDAAMQLALLADAAINA